MKLKLLIVAIPMLISTAGCTLHFPLEENNPSLASSDEPSATAGGSMSAAPTEPNTHDPVMGNSAPTPDIPH